MLKTLLIPLFCCLLSATVMSQSITITGRVTDVETDAGISFASIFVKGVDSTVSTDFDGYYKIHVSRSAKYIGAGCAGYEKVYAVIKRGRVMDFELEKIDSNGRQKTALKKSQSSAVHIIQKVIKNKAAHDVSTLNSYGYEAYTKIQVELIDLTEHFKKRKIFKPFSFVFDNIDTTSEIRPFLPFFLTETVSDYYHRKGSLAGREIIKASRVSGVDDVSISQFLGSSMLQTDIYSEYIELLRKQFVSPVSPIGLECYIYYLEDSQVIDHYKCYKIRFVPRSLKLSQLEGEMWVADSFFAIKRIRLRMQSNSKVSPINSITLYDEFEQVGSTIWMLKRERLSVNAIRFNNTPELVLRKNTSFSKFIINENKHTLDSIFRAKTDVAVADSANFKSEAYWERIRRNGGIPAHEDKVYNMIDTLAGMKITKRYVNLVQTIASGYVDVGPLSIGSVYSFISHNKIEGWRFKYGMRTSSRFSKVLRLGAYGAYGIRDHKGRYGAEALWLIKKDPRMSLAASYRFDLAPTRQYNSFYTTPDFWTTYGLRRFEAGQSIPLKLMEIREFRLRFYHEFKFGYSYAIGILNQELKPMDDFNFSYHTAADNSAPNTDIYSGHISEISLTQRFAWHERFLTSNFFRYGFGSTLPVLTLTVAVGVKGVLGSQFNYQRITAGIDDTRFLGLLGKLKYDIQAGKIFGTMPFIFLQIPNASETYISAWPRFNTITKYQFAADRFVQAMAEHHLEGLIFDRIPGFKKLKFREVWGAHMWWGDMTAANVTANNADLATNPLNTGLVKVQVADRKPFVEMNAGIENILSFFRIDAVWRMTYLDPRGTRFSFRYGNCGVRLTFEVRF